MPLVPRPFAPALAHGSLDEVLPGIHFVTGTMRMPGALPMRFSRSMTAVCEAGRVVLVNSVRLDEDGLAALERLGTVTDVVRLAGNHGMDDPFYADRYKAKVWVVKGQRYTAGFDTRSPDTYFTPDHEVDETSTLPLEGARLYQLHSKPPEALLLLPQHGGVCIAGDCLQNWHKPNRFFSLPARLAMPLMGFIKPANVGPAWLKNCKPAKAALGGILGLEFAHVLPSHGAPLLHGAREKYRPVLERLSS